MALPHPRRHAGNSRSCEKFKNIEVKNAVLTWDGYPMPQFVDGKEAYPKSKTAYLAGQQNSSSAILHFSVRAR